MPGIYTVAFWDARNGIIFGGDWNEKTSNRQNKAITSNGGKSWQLVSDGTGPGYRSSVKYFPQGNGKSVLVAGIPGISISYDSGINWKEVSAESWYAADFAPGENACWLAGNGKIGRVNWR